MGKKKDKGPVEPGKLDLKPKAANDQRVPIIGDDRRLLTGYDTYPPIEIATMHFREMDVLLLPFVKMMNHAATIVNDLSSTAEHIKALAVNNNNQHLHVALSNVTPRVPCEEGYTDNIFMEYTTRLYVADTPLEHAAGASVVASPDVLADPELAGYFEQIAECEAWFKFYMAKPVNQPESRIFGPISLGVRRQQLVVSSLHSYVPIFLLFLRALPVFVFSS